MPSFGINTQSLLSFLGPSLINNGAIERFAVTNNYNSQSQVKKFLSLKWNHMLCS